MTLSEFNHGVNLAACKWLSTKLIKLFCNALAGRPTTSSVVAAGILPAVEPGIPARRKTQYATTRPPYRLSGSFFNKKQTPLRSK